MNKPIEELIQRLKEEKERETMNLMNKPIKELIQRLNEPDYKYYGYELSRCEAELAISALEKQIPKKPIEEQGITPRCPYCENANYLTNEDEEENSYCGNCGQAIDWGNDDE